MHRALERAGFHRVRQRNSHLKLHSDAGRVVIVPMHRARGRNAARSSAKSGMTIDDKFIGFL